MRISGIISLLRTVLSEIENSTMEVVNDKVTKLDFEMATAVVECSVNIALSLLPASSMNKSKVEPKILNYQSQKTFQ